MRYIPKFQNGQSFYTIFDTIAPPKISSNQSQQASSRKSSNKDDDEGKLTEKDLFKMLEDIDGLPNERQALYEQLQDIFTVSKLTGRNIRDISSIYLRSLFQLKTAIDNKKQYDEALKTAAANGAMNEPAISPNGKLIIQKDDGSLSTVSLQEYSENPEEYAGRVMTVSNIANLRAYDSDFINKNEVFNIISNSMGFEAFQKLIDQAKISLSSTSYTRNGQFTAEGKASKGLEQLEKLKDDPRLQQIVGSVTLEGLYEYKLVDEDNLKQIKALVNYLVAVLPDRAKTWAAFKVGNSDKNKATQSLVFQYLLGSAKQSQSVDISYKGSVAHAMGKSSSGGKEEDPKAGYWRQVQAGQGGEDASFNILQGKGTMSVDGKYYGAVPGVEQNCSLGDFLAKSGANYLLKDSKKITFGNVKLITDSFDDVMVNTRSGSFVVTLPSKNGQVDFDVLDKYVEVMNELDRLKKDGLKENTPEYAKKYKDLMEEAQLSHLLNTNGQPRTDRFGNFLVLEGLTSDKARLVDPQTNKTVSVGDVKSNYILNAGDDSELYRILQDGLSSKERGDYKLDRNEWYDVPSYWGSYDRLYKGNIYIPITNNPINGMNADKNDMKESSAYEYEEATQIWNKTNNQGSTNSKELDR